MLEIVVDALFNRADSERDYWNRLIRNYYTFHDRILAGREGHGFHGKCYTARHPNYEWLGCTFLTGL